jgi:two-component system cell cycle response regulator DivK
MRPVEMSYPVVVMMTLIRSRPALSDEDAPTRQHPIIVLAEDDEDTRVVYGLILRSVGYQVADAMRGDDAVELTRSLRPDLVLMDIGLPGLDGWQASRVLKSDAGTKAIPLIAFSACVVCTADLNRESTFDGFILKPISPMELVRRVDAYLALVGAPPRRAVRDAGRFGDSARADASP